MVGWDAPWHWVILGVLVIALFGYKKLPDASRSLGRSLRIFKTEIKGMTEDDKARSAKADPPAIEPARAQTVTPVTTSPSVPVENHIAVPPVQAMHPDDEGRSATNPPVARPRPRPAPVSRPADEHSSTGG